MKKTILLIVMFSVCTMINAQHMKFMGIPIDGKINDFVSKLNSKGFTISEYNKDTDVGSRVLQGKFFGEDVHIYIHYTPSTKIVYQLRIIFIKNKFENCSYLKAEIENKVKEKYNYITSEGETLSGDKILKYWIYTPEMEPLGTIYCSIGFINENLGYALFMTYEDYINFNLNEKIKDEDI